MLKFKIFAIMALLLTGTIITGCTEEATDIPTVEMPDISETDSYHIAFAYLTHSPTFKFDGIVETLHHAETMTLRCPSCWTFFFEFDCASAGYGDRSQIQVATVITPHRAAITVIKGEITAAIIDDVWDMLEQEMAQY